MNEQEIKNKLCEKDNQIAYRNLLELETMTTESNELYSYFELFLRLLKHENSFVRVRGFRMICALAQWDKDQKINQNIIQILEVFEDENGLSIRQFLKATSVLLLYKPELSECIAQKLNQLPIEKYKESLQELIRKDISHIISNLS